MAGAIVRPLVLLGVIVSLGPLAIACGDDDTDLTGGQTTAAASPTDNATPSAPPGARPAVAALDQEAYRLSIVDKRVVQETCTYELATGSADCGERGVYLVEPAPASEAASCVVGLAGGTTPEFVLCTEPNGGESTFFVIQAASATPQAS